MGAGSVRAAGLQEIVDLRAGGQDQVGEPVVAAVQLQAEQVIDLVGVEQAGLEPPPCEPAEDRAQQRRWSSTGGTIVPRMVRAMTRNARLTWPASDGWWKPGCSSIATPGSTRSARRWPRSARTRGSARRCRTSRVSSNGKREDADVTATA